MVTLDPTLLITGLTPTDPPPARCFHQKHERTSRFVACLHAQVGDGGEPFQTETLQVSTATLTDLETANRSEALRV